MIDQRRILRSSPPLGISILELLLVLMCAAAIISWSINRYQIHQQRSQTIQMETDIKVLQRALDTYFHIQGCNNLGIFKNTLLEVSCKDLQEYSKEVVCSRSPWVTAYASKIIKTDDMTQTSPPKPIYQLQIQAVLSSQVSSGQQQWLQQQLKAKESDDERMLYWDSLPTNSYVQQGDSNWILNGDSSFFRAVENSRGAAGVIMAEYSGSYCAN
ncbi:MAG: hypothetical protein JSR33_00300 [Proteobacteria bacterium]|nr:hypothetical protein [Pseudomonadota bacterium]